MDRLISQFEVIRAIEKYVDNIFTKNMGDLINDIKAIPSAEPYKGMTNGEVLEEVFGSDFYPPLVFCADWYKQPLYVRHRPNKKERDNKE